MIRKDLTILYNRARAIEFMRRCGINALIATRPVNVRYFTGYHSWLDPMFRDYMVEPGSSHYLLPLLAVFTVEGQSAVIVNNMQITDAREGWAKTKLTYGEVRQNFLQFDPSVHEEDVSLYEKINASRRNPSATAAAAEYLRSLGLSNARIGIEKTDLNPVHIHSLSKELDKANFVDASNLIQLVRMVKTDSEISLLKKAAEISFDAANKSLGEVHVGVDMKHVVRKFRVLLAEQGAYLDHFAYGLRGTGISTHSSCVLRKSDYLYIDYGCIYNGYFSDSGLTLFVGRPETKINGYYRALSDCLDQAVELIKPGLRVSKVAESMLQQMKRAGIDHSFPHGHGIGLEVRDYPIIVPDNGLRIHDDCIDVSSDLPFEAGMVFSLEAAIFQYGRGSLNVERSFTLTETGCVPLIERKHDNKLVMIQPS